MDIHADELNFSSILQRTPWQLHKYPLQFLGWESLSNMITECCHTTTIHYFFSLNVFCKGADMDVCLTNYGHCNYISGKHACIFYDEVCLFLTAVLLKCKSMSFCCTTILHLCCWTKEVLLWTWCKWFVYCMYPLEYQALWAAQLQRARHDGGQCSVLVWLLWEGLAVSTQRPGGQSARHYSWVHLNLTRLNC